MNQSFQPFRIEEESIVALIFITVGYLLLLTLVTLTSRSNSLRLIGLGLVTAVAGVMYSSLVPTAALTTPIMMKIGFLLVLAGVLVPFASGSKTPATQTASTSGETSERSGLGGVSEGEAHE